MYEYISISGKRNWCYYIDPDAVHDVIDSLFRLGRNASDYSPLTPQQACSVQCIVWGNRKRSIDLTIVAEIRNINTRFFFATGATYLFLKDQLEFFTPNG